MRCSRCDEHAVMEEPRLCKEHFLTAFEKKVSQTIKEYRLLKKDGKVAVACSGGKDSTVLLHLLAKQGYEVTALAIDEGISGYRDSTLRFLQSYCKKHHIPLKTHSFKEEVGKTLDRMLPLTGKTPCHVCGVFRRHLLNRHAKKYDVIATGHNLDDEAQSILMNLLLNNKDVLPRLGPDAGVVQDERFIRRVKPLYLCREKEVMVYSYLSGLLTEFKECPNITASFRAEVRDFLNDHELHQKGFKESLVRGFLKVLPSLKKVAPSGPIGSCSICDEPSASGICSACRLRKELRLPASC